MDTIARIIVFLAGCYLILLAVIAVLVPQRAAAFLGGFATSSFKHHLELALRLIVGFALLRSAPRVELPLLFQGFGLLLLATSGVILAVPWKWHQRFAKSAVPRALPYLKLIGLCSMLLGLFLLVSAIRGVAPNEASQPDANAQHHAS